MSKCAKSQYAILESLIEHYFKSYVMNCSTKAYLRGNDLIAALAAKGIIITDKKAQIERPIRALRKIINNRLQVSGDEVIESVIWKGYRLNPKLIKLG